MANKNRESEWFYPVFLLYLKEIGSHKGKYFMIIKIPEILFSITIIYNKMDIFSIFSYMILL